MSIPVTTITATGCSVPAFADVLAGVQAMFQGIYGADIYIAPDSQDGQLIAAFASAFNDVNLAIQAAYLSFDPDYAQGAGLSSLVKINGLARQTASYSTAPATVIGQAETAITNGVAKDVNGQLWNLPVSVIIPSGGSINVTVTAQQLGALAAGLGKINSIYTPTFGWQSISNTAAATPGAPVEQDPTLKARRKTSTSIAAQTLTEAIGTAVGNVTGVTRSKVFENDTGAVDGNGIPAYSLAIVVEGGLNTDIAAAINLIKPPGTPTYGTTSVVVTDIYGLPKTINYFILTLTPIYVIVNGTALAGYLSTTATLIQQAVAQFLNTLDIGGSVPYGKIGSPVNLSGTAALTASGLTQAQLDLISATYSITSIYIGLTSSPIGTSDINLPFNQAAEGLTANIAVNIA